MEKTEQSLKKLEKTLERYRKNKTLVSPEDLKGRYRVPFRKLQEQLVSELIGYVIFYCYGGLKVFQSESQELEQQFQEELKRSGIEKELKKAAFEEYDLQKIQQIAEQHRKQTLKIYDAYFQSHTEAEKAMLMREENKNG